jgi:hypothetical protein
MGYMIELIICVAGAPVQQQCCQLSNATIAMYQQCSSNATAVWSAVGFVGSRFSLQAMHGFYVIIRALFTRWRHALCCTTLQLQ